MEKRSALVAFLCGSVCHAFNVGNVVANHQGAPGSLFGYAIATKDGADGLIIGAPTDENVGASYICNDQCVKDDSGKLEGSQGSMYGAAISWISPSKYIVCQPRQQTPMYCRSWVDKVKKVEHRRCEEKYSEFSELQYKMPGRCFIKTGIEESKMIEPKCVFRNKYNSPEIDCAFGFGFAAVGQAFDETAIVGQPIRSHGIGGSTLIYPSGSSFSNVSTASETDMTRDISRRFSSLLPDFSSSLGISAKKNLLWKNYDQTYEGSAIARFGKGAVVGSPSRMRNYELAGRVVFYEVRSKEALKLSKYPLWAVQPIEPKVGEGFGSSLATGTFGVKNGDSDLVVGSPYWFEDGKPDLGRVTVFRNHRGEGIFEESLILKGEIPNARFGSSLAVYDLDLDGFDDLLIASPYGEKGAISVYNGHSGGLRAEPTQVIESEGTLNWYGLAMGLRNRQLIVSAPKKDYVDVLALRTPLKLTSFFRRFPEKPIKRNEFTVSYEFCYQFSSTGSDTIRINVACEHDQLRVENEKVFFSGLSLQRGRPFCQEVQFELKQNPWLDHQHDLPVIVRATLSEGQDHIALDPNSGVNLARNISFDKQCGADNICMSELKLGRVETTTETVVYGAENVVEATTMLEIRGENAFGTFIFINTTSKLNVAMLLFGANDQKSIPCRQLEKNLKSCLIGNPARPDLYRLKFRFDINPDVTQTKTDIVFYANSTNDFPAESEKRTLSLPHEIRTLFQDSLKVSPSFITFEKNSPFPIRWDFSVENKGPSTVDGAIKVNFPKWTKGGRIILKNIIAELSLEQDNSLTPKVKCEVPSVVSGALFNRTDDFHLEKIDDFVMFDCSSDSSSARCVEISCQTDQLMKKNDILSLFLEAEINDEIFSMLNSSSKFIPEFTFEVGRGPYEELELFQKETSKIEFTVLMPVAFYDSLPVLWIVFAVVTGLLLLAVISTVMYKTGCFTSPKRDECDVALQYETAVSYRPENNREQHIMSVG